MNVLAVMLKPSAPGLGGEGRDAVTASDIERLRSGRRYREQTLDWHGSPAAGPLRALFGSPAIGDANG